MNTVVVIGLGSDIGRELAARFAAGGWTVKGTHHRTPPGTFESTPCDLTSAESISAAGRWLAARCKGWRALVVAAGTEEPIGPFWDCDAEDWDRGVRINTLSPLRLLRTLYPLRDAGNAPSVAFFSGSGTNNAAPAYSAYAASKIMLIKMCELLDAESSDTSFFIVGPGIVRTKIHGETLKAAAHAGANHQRVVDFLDSGDPGTSHDDVYACVRWCMEAGKAAVGGRNIALVHDAWRKEGASLKQWLSGDANRYKLRRFGNEHRFERAAR
jgi:NAD(P)-dependent dehydrogenase (short-subunit alcohol dehydrogenase family)